MNLELQKPYEDIINKIIGMGIADSPSEVVKQSLLAFAQQFEFEEQYLVNKAVSAETKHILQNKEQLTKPDDVFALAGL